MATTFRSVANASNATSGTIVISKPAGVVDGDILHAFIAFTGGTGTTVTPPAGWALARRVDSGASAGFAAFSKVAASEPASWTWTFSGTPANAGSVLAYSGGDQTSPVVSADAATDAGASVGAPSLTLPNPGMRLSVGFAGNLGGVGFTLAAPLVEISDHNPGTGIAMATGTAFVSAAGATGALAATSGNFGANFGITMALGNNRRVAEQFETTTLRNAESEGVSV